MFGFTYYAAGNGDRYKPFKMRDGLGLVALTNALASLGYEYEDTFLNFPHVRGAKPEHVDLGQFRPDDLIVIPLRPPLDDREFPNRKEIRGSFNNLETALFQALRRVFRTCSRPEVVLQNDVAAISAEIAQRGSIEFHQNNGTRYHRFHNPITGEITECKDKDPMTAAYLVRLEHAWEGGPGVVAAFGMGGTETLIWCSVLATRYRSLLATASFAMAELPEAPLSLRDASVRSFADRCDVRILGVAPRPGSSSIGRTGPCGGGPTSGPIEAQA